MDSTQLFTDRACLCPNQYCISSTRSDKTYKDVERECRQIANGIQQSLSKDKNGVVGILLDDPETLALMSVVSLKASTKLVFIDPAIEKEIIKQIIKDNEAVLLITDQGGSVSFDDLQLKIVDVDHLRQPAEVISNDVKSMKPSLKIYIAAEDSYREFQLDSANLNELFIELDKIIKCDRADKIYFASDIPLNEFITEVLYTFISGGHIILGSESISENLETDEKFCMDFSLFYFGSYSAKTDVNDKYYLLLESVKHGDRNGYSAVWTPERHFNEFGGLFPNPSVLGAALAVTTSKVQIRAGSLVSPLHHSVRIAEDWSIIDNLSQGRAALSFASGWQCDDFVFYPERYEKRHQQMLDQIDEVQTLWKGEKLELKNGLGKDIQVEVFPKPIQPELPIWVTVSGKTETFIDAGRMGANILTHLLWQDSSELKEKIAAYRLSLKQHGFDPESRIVSVMLHTYVGESDEEVKNIVREPLKEYIKSSVHLIEAMTKSNSDTKKNTVGRYGNVSDKIPPHLLEELVEIAFNRFFDEAALLGSPKKCHALLKRLRDYGINELACLIDFGLDPETILKGLDHLSQLKTNYDFKTSKKYRPSVLRLTSDSFKNESLSTDFQKVLRVTRKVIVTGEMKDTEIPFRFNNLVELEYGISEDKTYVGQREGSELAHQSTRDLSHVNSIIDEDF